LSDRKEISSLVRYLIDMVLAGLQPWFSEDLRRRLDKEARHPSASLFHEAPTAAKIITRMMSVSYLEAWRNIRRSKAFLREFNAALE
jgi:hypothetical protein